LAQVVLHTMMANGRMEKDMEKAKWLAKHEEDIMATGLKTVLMDLANILMYQVVNIKGKYIFI